jgi:hypothetical protein
VLGDRSESGAGEVIAGRDQGRARITALDCAAGALEQAAAAGAAVGVFHQPPHVQPQHEGEIERAMGRKREGGRG